MFARHRLGPTNKLDCPHAMGTNAFSAHRGRVISSLFAVTIAVGYLPRMQAEESSSQLWSGCGAASATTQPAMRDGSRSSQNGRRENANELREHFVQPSNCPTQAKIGLEWATTTVGKTGDLAYSLNHSPLARLNKLDQHLHIFS